MTRIIDKLTAVNLLQNEVYAKGSDYVYKAEFSSCSNFGPGGEPRCIVGHVFAGLGLTEAETGNSNVESAASELLNGDSSVRLTAGATAVLAIAQAVQDHGGTWGEALAAARRVVYLFSNGFIKEGEVHAG